jgi:hypothetical protein
MSKTMGAPYCRSRIVFPLVAVLLVDLVFLRPGVAAEARSDTHAEGKSSTSGKASGARAPSGSESGRAGAARHDTPSSHGEAGKGQQSIHSGGNQAGKNVGAPTPGGADSGIDTSIAPSRTSDRGQRSGQEKPVANFFAGRNTHRGVQPVPHASNRPLRNAIGIPLSPQQNPETRDRAPPSPFSATREAPSVTTALPGYSTSRVTTAGIGPRHYAPNINPIVASPIGKSGAITGTGLIRRNSAQSQIGGAKATVAGINGTTIRPKH